MFFPRFYYLSLAVWLCACGGEGTVVPVESPDLVIRRGGVGADVADAVDLYVDVVNASNGVRLSVAEAFLSHLDAGLDGEAQVVEAEVDEYSICAKGLTRGRYRLKVITDSMEEIERAFDVRPGSYSLRMRLQVAEVGVIRGRLTWDGVAIEDRPTAVLVQFESTASGRWVIGEARRAVAIQSIDLRRTDRFELEIPDKEARVRFHIVDPHWRGEVATVASPGSPREVELVIRRR